MKYPSGEEIQVTCTKPESLNPSWSYLELAESDSPDFQFVTAIKEKDLDLMRAGAKGVVGAYFFSSRKLFEDIYEKSFDSEKGEFYISKMIQAAIQDNIRVIATQADYGYPLGNQHEIDKFVRAFKLHQIPFQSATIFCDVDGVIIEHDNGYHSERKSYDYQARIIEENVLRLRSQYDRGSFICLTTSRPEIERIALVSYLKKHGVPFNALVMGLNPGPRFLINDRKNSEPAVNTSSALSNIRNEVVHGFEHKHHLGWEIENYLTGGSGVETLRLKNIHIGSFVRKCVPFKGEFQRHIDILKLQHRWYEKVEKYIPMSIPKTLYCGEENGFFVLDMADLGDLENFRGAKRKLSQQGNSILLDNLFTTLNEFYDPFKKYDKGNQNDSINNRNKLIRQKALPGIQMLANQAQFPIQDLRLGKRILVNGSFLDNPMTKLNSILTRKKDLFGSISDIQTLIHGDLTFENVLVKDLDTILIDPLGAFMDPDMQSRQELHLEAVSPIWDLIKLLQSALLDYETWNYATSICTFDSENGINTNSEINFPWKSSEVQLILEHFSEFGLDLTESNIKLMLAILMFRLIPYKIPTSIEKSVYCLVVGTKLLEEI